MRVGSVVAMLYSLAAFLAASAAHADRVHLVGGSVIEGKATRDGERIVVELGSGELTLSARDVERIERSDSDIERLERRLAKLGAGDVHGMMELADFCRDHDMRDRELQLLLRVVEVSPDHLQARTRLGYVRAEHGGWIRREEQLRAKGLVEHDGEWITREQLVQIERARADADRAAHERDQAKLQLEKQRIELQHARQSASAPSDALAPAPASPMIAAPPLVYYSDGYPAAGYDPGWRRPVEPTRGHASPACAVEGCRRTSPVPEDPRNRPFPIPGVRNPFDYLR